MNKAELAAMMEAFQNKGGKVDKVEEGKRAIDPAIRHCKCGCNGDWTDHTMRQGESGTRSNW
jgi:hypothetical protein